MITVKGISDDGIAEWVHAWVKAESEYKKKVLERLEELGLGFYRLPNEKGLKRILESEIDVVVKEKNVGFLYVTEERGRLYAYFLANFPIQIYP
ncbi:MAG: hypothetical protein QXV17_11965 [Candidatus Micrarchaeaceae archaeon]